MEKPLIRLGPKNWLSGIAPGAHSVLGGIFYKADGITPLYDAAGTASKENGSLQPGATPTDFSSGLADNIIGGHATSYNGPQELYMIGDAGHFYKKVKGSSAVTDLRSGTPISNPKQGVVVWGPAGGTTYLFYWMNGYIGRWNLAGSYPTGWNDTWQARSVGNNNVVTPVHKFVGNVYYGNGDILGALLDSGSATITYSDNVLDVPTREAITTINDDGTYLVVGTSDRGDTTFTRNKIYFWDTFSPSWTREYTIHDPGIYKIINLGGIMYAFGTYGIWEFTFSSAPRKVLARSTGFSQSGSLDAGYGVNKALVYGDSAIAFANDTTIDTFGKLQPDAPNALLKPFKIPSGYPTFMNAELDAGRIYLGTTTGKLYGFDFNGATHDTGNTAQTVYIDLEQKYQITRIDVVFAEPLASGDAFSVGVFSDEDTASTSFGTASFSTDGAIRRKVLAPQKKVICEEQISLLYTFTSGSVKVKYVEVYGQPMTP